MATQFHVFGPTAVYWGAGGSESLVGQTNGQTLIRITEVIPYKEIPTDEFGGQPADFIQTMGHATVQIAFAKWDDSIIDPMLAAIAATSTTGSPAFENPGETGAVGMLRLADGGYRSLKIVGTKPTASNGGYTFTFPKAFRSPFGDTEWADIGVDYAQRIVTMWCHADTTASPPKFYTRTSTT